MSRIPVALLALALLPFAMPLSEASHSPPCANSVGMHSYGSSPALVSSYSDYRYGVLAQDTCPFYDGETEYGVGGGRFAAGTAGEHCDWVATSHHAYGNGAQYWADDSSGFASIIYSAGADGPALVQVTGCETDGIISNDDTTDPLDCGSGDTGFYAPALVWTPATLWPNGFAPAPGTSGDNGECNPFDGFVWVVLAYGLDLNTGIFSTPTQGHIWD